ncbi:MAG: PLP-dependent aminotransferase family protein [Hyphomicrobiaceae bacterium]|nr:MAG: PLP-dependent aminotransferase family protein [Hyphomicrobiaceae bacterium]
MARGLDRQSAQSAITVDRTLAVPLFRQVYDRVRVGIANRTFQPGARLPSERALADELGVARGTIEDAYALLAAEGYVERRGPAGSVVAPALGHDSALPPYLLPLQVGGNLSPALAKERAPSPFRLGQPALDAFPAKLWSRLLVRQARRPVGRQLGGRGHAPLRSAIARYLALSRGVVCSPDQILITNGYQGAIDLIARSLLRLGDDAWIEEPGYVPARLALARTGARIVPVGVDRCGLRVTDGIAAAPCARLAVTTPSHQCPTCVALSLPRRLALLEWAAKTGAWIVEDDYDGEFHYGGRPLPALKSLDRQHRVIYAGSFSKTLHPELRLGFLVAPGDLVDRLDEAARLQASMPGSFMQAVVAAFMDEGHYARHLQRMRRLYASRRAALAEAMARTFGDALPIDIEPGGMHLLGRLRTGVSDTEIAAASTEAALAVHALSSLSIARRPPRGLLLSFTNVPEQRALELCRRFHRAVGHLLGGVRGNVTDRRRKRAKTMR